MAHFEFLVEDQSGEKALDILIPKILGSGASYRIHAYKGIGRVPKDLKPRTAADKRILLDQLPRILRGYGSSPHCGIVVVVCDLDDRDKPSLLEELHRIWAMCDPRPQTLFCVATEEMEAWYLGDMDAVYAAYPRAKREILRKYENDSICGTWELLADALYKGGRKSLSDKGWQEVGRQKSIWAEAISPHMVIERNLSPSFRDMCGQLQGV